MKKRGTKIKRQTAARIGVALFVFALGAAIYAVADVDARTIPGVMLFKWRYAHASDHAAVLKKYRAQIWEHGGGYLPASGDEFLRDRFLASTSLEEISALVDFYVRQGSGRPSTLLPQMSLTDRFRFVRGVMQRLDTYRSWNEQQGAFVLIEQLRTQSSLDLMKASVTSSDPRNYGKGWNWRWNNIELPKIKTLYRRWWKRKETPAEKFARSPLRNSHYEIETL